MPFLTPDTTDEPDTLATFAAQQIRQLATALHGLSPQQLAATPSASAMSLGALARHALFVTENVLAGVRAAPERTAGADRPVEVAALEGAIDPGALRSEDSAESLIALLEEQAQVADQLLRKVDLDTEVPIPDQPWFVGAEHWNNRWSTLHLIEEIARHAGHADIIRESIDGKGTYELNVLAEGGTWPPEGW
ncbi:hypothetical protein DEO23_00150 [Brachybacterium endophyticum]|uniref:DUF664 domain-containing protein n=1 Tax=Brachybacterium endophyticum TaxID=2182385 RepID=A0A2U2RPU8_9MICO|nr:DUF664 domain-containing protein [Brachybacterium endophyticum]PWH07871.1 hypothetical protein DEO23_00150 [Brachybacterium endophyticum]